MDRRHFLTWLKTGSLAISLSACSPKKAAEIGVETQSPNPAAFQTIGSVNELEQGSILVTQGLPVGLVLVVKNPAAPDQPIAVNPICTPKGCQVNWSAKESHFICPCDGSKFDRQGMVIQGPANQNLKTYEAKIEDQRVMVKPQ